MKKLITIAMMALGLALTGACNKDDAAKDAMKDATKAMDKAAGAASKAAGNAAADVKAAAGGATKEAYITAAIATACASKKFKDADLAKEIQKIQKAAGFDTQGYVKMAQEVAKDSDASMKIAKGAAACQ